MCAKNMNDQAKSNAYSMKILKTCETLLMTGKTCDNIYIL